VPPYDRRMPPRDGLRREDQVAIGVSTDDDQVAIDLEEPPSQRSSRNLQRRNDALCEFHDGVPRLSTLVAMSRGAKVEAYFLARSARGIVGSRDFRVSNTNL